MNLFSKYYIGNEDEPTTVTKPIKPIEPVDEELLRQFGDILNAWEHEEKRVEQARRKNVEIASNRVGTIATPISQWAADAQGCDIWNMNCITNVLTNAKKAGAYPQDKSIIPGNQTWLTRHPEFGYKIIPKKEITPGDIVQFYSPDNPVMHAATYVGKPGTEFKDINELTNEPIISSYGTDVEKFSFGKEKDYYSGNRVYRYVGEEPNLYQKLRSLGNVQMPTMESIPAQRQEISPVRLQHGGDIPPITPSYIISNKTKQSIDTDAPIFTDQYGKKRSYRELINLYPESTVQYNWELYKSDTPAMTSIVKPTPIQQPSLIQQPAPLQTPISFNDAFADARKKGLSTFDYNGKSYGTDLETTDKQRTNMNDIPLTNINPSLYKRKYTDKDITNFVKDLAKEKSPYIIELPYDYDLVNNIYTQAVTDPYSFVMGLSDPNDVKVIRKLNENERSKYQTVVTMPNGPIKHITHKRPSKEIEGEYDDPMFSAANLIQQLAYGNKFEYALRNVTMSNNSPEFKKDIIDAAIYLINTSPEYKPNYLTKKTFKEPKFELPRKHHEETGDKGYSKHTYNLVPINTTNQYKVSMEYGGLIRPSGSDITQTFNDGGIIKEGYLKSNTSGIKYTLSKEIQGPSHTKGGIKMNLNGQPVEVEGGELMLRGNDGSVVVIPRDKKETTINAFEQGNQGKVKNIVNSVPDVGNAPLACHGGRWKWWMEKGGDIPPTGMFSDSLYQPIQSEVASTTRVAMSDAEKMYQQELIRQDKQRLVKEYETGDKPKAMQEFENKYGQPLHTYRYNSDPIYRANANQIAEITSKMSGSITEPPRQTPPNLMFMMPSGSSQEAQNSIEDVQMGVIGSVLPIPGLEQMGQVKGLTNLVKPLVKGFNVSRESIKGAEETGNIVKSFRQELLEKGIVESQKTPNLPWKESIRKGIEPWGYNLGKIAGSSDSSTITGTRLGDIKGSIFGGKNPLYRTEEQWIKEKEQTIKNINILRKSKEPLSENVIKQLIERPEIVKEPSLKKAIDIRDKNRITTEDKTPLYFDVLSNRYATWDMYLGKPQTKHPLYDISELTTSKKDVIYTIKEDFMNKPVIEKKLSEYVDNVISLEETGKDKMLFVGDGDLVKKGDSWIVPDTDMNMFGTMGGFHWEINKLPDGNYKVFANDVWDLHPFGNIEVGKALGIGKPLNVKVGFIVDGKTKKIINTFGLGTGIASGSMYSLQNKQKK